MTEGVGGKGHHLLNPIIVAHRVDRKQLFDAGEQTGDRGAAEKKRWSCVVLAPPQPPPTDRQHTPHPLCGSVCFCSVVGMEVPSAASFLCKGAGFGTVEPRRGLATWRIFTGEVPESPPSSSWDDPHSRDCYCTARVTTVLRHRNRVRVRSNRVKAQKGLHRLFFALMAATRKRRYSNFIAARGRSVNES